MSRNASLTCQRGALLLAIIVAIALVGCGGSKETGPEVSDPWARTLASSQMMGAAYMTIGGGSEDDKLVAVSAPAEIAAEAQIHETVAADEGSGMDGSEMEEGAMGDDDAQMGGEMTMRQVSSIDIPAGETVMLEPGGYHVMLMDLAEPLVEGTTFELTLTFEQAGEQTVMVTVRDA